MARCSRLGWLLVPLLLAAAPPSRDAEVVRLVRQLGSDDFEQREAASLALERMGRAVRPALARFREHPDLEVRHRVRDLLDRLAPLRRGPLVLAGSGRPVYAVAFSPDSRLLASGDWLPAVHLYDVASAREVCAGKGHGGLIRRVAFTPDGKYLLSASLDKTVRLWDVATGNEVRRFVGHGDNAMSVAVAPDGKRFASGANDQTVRVWDLGTGKELALVRDTDRAWCLAWARDGKEVLTGGGNADFRVRIHDVASGKLVRTLAGHTSSVHDLAVSPDGKAVVTASWDNTVRLWEVSTGKELRVLKGHTTHVYGVAFAPDGRRAASSDGAGQAILWGLRDGAVVRRLSVPSITLQAVAFSPDGRYLAAGGSDGKVRVYDVADE